MKKSLEFQIKRLAKLMAYILGRRPDEFGLVLDEEGFVSLKELQRALTEEEGWSHVRIALMEQAAYESKEEGFEIREGRIRAQQDRAVSPWGALEPVKPPAILYFAARRKAYAHILQHGLEPAGKPYVPLAATEELALRMGRRRDPQPVLLTIQAEQAYEEGFTFTRPDELIYLVDSMPVRYISGPPVKQAVETAPKKPRSTTILPAGNRGRDAHAAEIPGYDALRMAYGMKAKPKKRKEKELSWKKSARKFRRQRGRE